MRQPASPSTSWGQAALGCLQARRKQSQPARSSRTCQRKQAAATIHSPLAARHSPPARTCQRTQAAARSRSRPPRRIFPPEISARPWRWNDRAASGACRSRSALLELFNPARHAVRLQAFVDAQLAGLFTGNIRGFPAGIIRVRPRLAGGLGRALVEIAVVACLLLFHQAVVVDDQRAGGHVVQAGAVAADEQHGSQVVHRQRLEPLQGLDIQVMGQFIPDQLARDLVAGEVVAGQAGAHPGTLVTRSTFPGLYPVLAPERPPDGKPAPTVVAGQADAHPGTLVARSTFPMLYPVLAPERPPDGKPAPTVVAGQADAHPGTLVARSTFPMLYPVLAPERPPDGKPGPMFLAATLSVVLLQPVAGGLLNLLRPPSKVRAQAPNVTPEPALVNHAEE